MMIRSVRALYFTYSRGEADLHPAVVAELIRSEGMYVGRDLLALKLRARARGWIEEEDVSTLIVRVSTTAVQLYVLQALVGVLRYHH